jgi:hypothetical protein
LNNPIIYNDPTGHLSVSPDDNLDVWTKTDGETDGQEDDTYSDIWDVWGQEVNLRTEPSSEDSSPPVLTSHIDRRESIINDTPAVIPIQGNPDADSSKPWYEWAGRSQVKKHDEIIIEVASSSGVDPNLIRAIIYMETTHGWYDAPLVWIGKNKSILPMNINVGYWKNLGYSRDDLKDPQNNIEAGTKILKGIQDRIQPQTVEGTATLYNNLAADKVTDYGARVADIYQGKPWAGRDYYSHPPGTAWEAMTDKNYLRELAKEIN